MKGWLTSSRVVVSLGAREINTILDLFVGEGGREFGLSGPPHPRHFPPRLPRTAFMYDTENEGARGAAVWFFLV